MHTQPFELDYLQVAAILWELLAQLYARLGHVTTPEADSCGTAAYVDAYQRLDARIMVRVPTRTGLCPPPHRGGSTHGMGTRTPPPRSAWRRLRPRS
jgi:hypothetical protein